MAKDGCHVREFYGIGYTKHDPTERHKEMSKWLTNNAKFCTTDDYVILWNNLAEWAGNSDSSELRNKIIQGHQDAEIRQKK